MTIFRKLMARLCFFSIATWWWNIWG